MKIYTYEQVDKLLKDIAIAIERKDLSLMPKEPQPLEITEKVIDTWTEEVLGELKGDDRILPEYYFRVGINAVLANIKENAST